MPSVLAYHRPTSLDEAGALLDRPNTVAVAGGTVAVPQSRVQRETGVEVVDLQALGLTGIDADGDNVRLGAMVRLDQLMGGPVPLLAQLAQRELPSALRNQATVGGTLGAGGPESGLLAALLVHGAVVHRHGRPDTGLADYLASPSGLVTAITVETGGTTAVASTGRTPQDDPIVAAVARATDTGTALALTGVAPTVVLADPASPTANLSPSADFRGSVDYRLHLAKTLSARVLEEVQS